MITYIGAVVLVLIAGGAVVMLRRVLQAVPPSGWLVVDEIGVIERDLRKLKEVVVILDTIERPYHLLLDAVLNNFSESVRYHFFVAEQNFQSCYTHFKPFFEQLIEVAANIKGSQIDPKAELCYIYKIPYRREGYPYIFYCYANGIDPLSEQRNNMHIIAFRGCDKARGIAELYKRVEPAEARNAVETTFGMLINSGNIKLPEWLLHLKGQEYATEETLKLIEYRPSVILHAAEVREIDMAAAAE
jgi:hypothetical protein